MKKKKIAIIGAGIIGLYLADHLSKDYEVVVFEKKKEIGKESCSGLLSERILDFIPQSKGLIENKIDSALIHFPRKTIRVNFSKSFLAIDRAELDKKVAESAQDSGANIILNHFMEEIPENFDFVIGCDGANSFIRKKLGLKEPKSRLGIRGFVDKRSSENYVETWAVKKEKPSLRENYGFIWKIPRAKKTEYGILAACKVASEEFNKFLEERKINLKDKRADLVTNDFGVRSNKTATLCGESLGLTKPWSGGGVIWGLIASNILLKNFPDFLSYQRELKKFFLPKIYFSKLATKTTYFLGFKIPWVLPKNIKMESDFLK